MTGFVAMAPADVLDPSTSALDLVAGDGWYPGVSIAQARASLRIPDVVTPARIRDALRAGILNVRHELRPWQALRIALGFGSLAASDADTIDDKSVLELLYTRAVFAFAAAELVDTHHDIGATNDGKDRADARASAADEHRRNATHAIRDMLGTSRTAVELI